MKSEYSASRRTIVFASRSRRSWCLVVIQVPITEPKAPTIDPETAAKPAMSPEFMDGISTCYRACGANQTVTFEPCIDRNLRLEKPGYRATRLRGIDGSIEFYLARARNLS